MGKAKYLYLLVLVLFVGACSYSQKSNKEKTVVDSLAEGDYESVTLQRIIDGSKQNAKMLGLIYSNTTMNKGKIKFSLSKRQFKKEGYDGDTYDKIQSVIKEYNKMIDSDTAKKAQASVSDFVQFVSKKLDELVKQ